MRPPCATLFLFFILISFTACSGSTKQSTRTSGSDRTTGEQPGPKRHHLNAPAPDPSADAYDFTTHARACEGQRASRAIPEEQRCRRDSECGLCHDGSRCGTIMRVDLLRKMGAQCRRQDRDECEEFGVHCCMGRCMETAISGECKKGSYWVEGKCN